jgi:membrane protein
MFPNFIANADRLVWGNTLHNKGLPGKAAAIVLRYLYAIVRDILAGQLTLRAMSLVYTTLLSVVPLIALSFSVLKGLGIHNELRPVLYRVMAPLGPQGAEIVDEVVDLVDNVSGGLLGGISLAFFIFTAISMVQKVEESFNYVWHVAQPRSLARRFSEYLVVLLIGPVVVVVALGLLASLRNADFVQWLLAREAFGPVAFVVSGLAPYVLISAVFTFLYIFVPNTGVKLKSAAVGGIVGGVLWVALGALFTAFVLYSTQRQLIYSSFAVPISALIWLYLSWLVLLVGAQLAFYHQRPAFLRIGRREPSLSNSMRECLALNIMYSVGMAFRNKDRKVTLEDVSAQLKIPSIVLAPITERLEKAGLVIATENEHLLPGREVSRIRLADILEVVRKRGDTGSYRGPAWTKEVAALGKRFDSAIDEIAGDQTLADLLDSAEKPKD